MITGDNIPGNANTNEFDLNNGGWILIGILIAIIIVIAVIAIWTNYKKSNTIDKLKELSKNYITNEEQDLLLKYRKLNPQGKNIVKNTLSNLEDNEITTKTE